METFPSSVVRTCRVRVRVRGRGRVRVRVRIKVRVRVRVRVREPCVCTHLLIEGRIEFELEISKAVGRAEEDHLAR